MVVQGYIRDAQTGEPLAGVNVALRSMQGSALISGTTTNSEGFFSQMVLSGQYIELTYIGYRTQIPVLRDQYSAMTILMERDTVNVPEAVAVAYRARTNWQLILAVAIGAALAYYLITRE